MATINTKCPLSWICEMDDIGCPGFTLNNYKLCDFYKKFIEFIKRIINDEE